MMLIFGRKVISEQLQKESLLFLFCQDFAVSNLIIHSSEQLAKDAVKHGSHDMMSALKNGKICQLSV